MKKLLLVLSIILFHYTCLAQKDTATIFIDTINVHGKVVDESGELIADALIVTQVTFDKRLSPAVRTDKYGNFQLEGVEPNCKIWVYSEKGVVSFSNNGSRYLLIKVPFFKPQLLNNSALDLRITAKKDKIRPKMELKPLVTGPAVYTMGLHIESPSSYPGGLAKFFSFLKENIHYPAIAIEKGIEGNVIVEFTIDKNGFVTSPTLIRDIGYGCGEHVIEVLKRSKKWHIAMQAGKSLSTLFSIEIPFQLVD